MNAITARPDRSVIIQRAWRRRRQPVAVRFWRQVDASGDCWLWTGTVSWKGYGKFSLSKYASDGAHRMAWRLLVGRIPTGRQIDHLCRVRLCVNPDHLELVTPRENFLRGYSPVAIAHRRAA